MYIGPQTQHERRVKLDARGPAFPLGPSTGRRCSHLDRRCPRPDRCSREQQQEQIPRGCSQSERRFHPRPSPAVETATVSSWFCLLSLVDSWPRCCPAANDPWIDLTGGDPGGIAQTLTPLEPSVKSLCGRRGPSGLHVVPRCCIVPSSRQIVRRGNPCGLCER